MNLDPETENRLIAAEARPRPDQGFPTPSGANAGRGRPSLMSSAAVLEKIGQLAGRREGLFRVHHTHPGLYARARRQFGSWAAAVRAAGVDYDNALNTARRRSIQARRRRRQVENVSHL